MRTFFVSIILVTLYVTFSAAGQNAPVNKPLLAETDEYEALHFLMEMAAAQKQIYGAPTPPLSIKDLELRLLNSVHSQILMKANLVNASSFKEKTTKFVKDEVLPRLNIVAFAKLVAQTTKIQGPRFAIVFSLSEGLEKSLYFIGARHPDLIIYLLPIIWSHAFDAIAAGIWFGIPVLKAQIKGYRQYGGILRGAPRYREFLTMQKEELLVDWYQAIDVQAIDENRDVVILKTNLTERLTPQSWHKFILPHRWVQRLSTPSISIRELEAIAKKSGVPVPIFKDKSVTPTIYSKLLIKEIMMTIKGEALLSKSIPSMKVNTVPLDSREILYAKSASDLKELGESASALARRLSWLTESLVIHLRENHFLASGEYKALRSVDNLWKRDLFAIADTNYVSKDEGYEALLQTKNQIRSLLKTVAAFPRCLGTLENLANLKIY